MLATLAAFGAGVVGLLIGAPELPTLFRARQIAAGNLVYRTPAFRNDQSSDLGRDFNDMAAGPERLQREELARQRLEGEMDLACWRPARF
jgi:hypothetical protein